MSTTGHCCHSTAPCDQIPPIKRRLAIMGSIFLGVFAVSFLAPFEALNDSMLSYLGIVWWAVLIGAYVPAHWFMQYLGPDFAGMLVTLLFATVLEVCLAHRGRNLQQDRGARQFVYLPDGWPCNRLHQDRPALDQH